MLKPTLVILALLNLSSIACADTSGGSSGMALAALMAQRAPSVSAANKWRLMQYLGNHSAGPAAPPLITITAKGLQCISGNVAENFHSCELDYGTSHHTVKGRAANELYATAVENGVQPDGAAGKLEFSLKDLTCTVKPHDIGTGGAVNCTWTMQ